MADDKNPFNPPKLKTPTDNATAVREEGYGFEYDDSSGQSQIKDLSYNTKVTIARYMSGLTKGKPTLRQSIDGTPASPPHPNRFPISYPDATYNAQSAQFDPATGYPLPVETTTNSDAFMPQNSLDPRSKNFETKTANYTQTISDTGGTKIWDGGDRNPIKTVLDGNKVLGSTNIRLSPNISPEFAQRADEPTKNADRFVGVYQSKVLSANRFTGGVSIAGGNVVQQEKVAAERIVQGSTPSGFSTPTVVTPGKLQKPYVGPTSSEEVFSDSNRVDLGQLAMVGHTLVARAAGILNSDNKGYDPTSLKAPFEAAAPNKSQFGIAKYSQALFNVYDVINSLPIDSSGQFVSAVKDPKANNPGGGGTAQANDPLPGYSTHDSYGAFYSSLYPFSQGSPAETAANVILVAISQLVELAFIAISEQINNGKSTNISSKAEKKTYTLGSYLYVNEDDKTIKGIERFLGIKPVRRTTFGRALSAGIVAFLGGDIVKTGKGSYEVNVTSLLSKALVENQQFKIIALRSIMRSVTELVAKLSGLTPVGAVMLASNAVLLEIKNSKIVTLLNTFSQLGDVVYGASYQGEQTVISSNGDKIVQNVFAPSINPGDVASNYTKNNRLKTSVSNVPAHLLPPVGVDKFSNVNTGKFIIAKDKQNPFKLERGTAEKLEKDLSSEYVPFYIRDMRTNEVIGFHAFLKTLTDNYTPGYDSQEFYGRGEPIHLYKGSTNREIAVTFMMAAMSEDDFKVMWMKINKLITLVYPQYTQGRQIELDGNKMIQPFSQIIGSSPMVRLRIGDVIQSNYSDVSLRNLFGESTDKFQVNQKQTSEIELYKQFFAENNLSNPPTSDVAADWQKRIDEIDANDQKKNSKVKQNAKKEKSEFNPTSYLNAADTADYITARMTLAASGNKNEEAAAKIKELTDKAKQSPLSRSDPAVTWYDSSTSNTTDNSPSQKTYSQKFEDFKNKQPVTYPDFFGENNNTIVKSFKENGAGGGLAGFIGSLQFNWLQEGHTWETNNLNGYLEGVSELGVAPKIVEIQMSFKPVHDIAPGLNSDGYNRAPVYPLKFMKDRLK